MYSYDTEVSELAENVVSVNVGPSHPAMHGTLRVKLQLAGEKVLACEQEIGFLHTGFEKLGEHHSFNQFITVTDRMNYLSPLNNNIGYALAVEELLGIEVPRRGQVIRTILAEMSRIADHIFCVGLMTMDLGAFSSVLWTMIEREKLYDIFEATTGTRLTTSYTRVGGLAFDLPEGFEARTRQIMDTCEQTLGQLRDSFVNNKIFLDRTQGVGVITKDQALSFGLSGPVARASGVPLDQRAYRPYLVYPELDFSVPLHEEGDCLARYLIRIDELEQSIAMVRQALKLLEPGPINHESAKRILPSKDLVYRDMESLIHHFKVVMPGQDHGIHPPKAELYSSTEAPNGELGFFLVSDGSHSAYRMRVRSPSFYNYQLLSHILPGHMVSDLVAILGSMNVIAGELDR
ncbi:MAG: NADH-quinone oxidoreductase subunit D [Myxococcales bacterium]|nr:NADH-quinone oxidoreductase subunit D [Myxococcales bacterium]